jgi:hypothetical protein
MQPANRIVAEDSLIQSFRVKHKRQPPVPVARSLEGMKVFPDLKSQKGAYLG